MSSIHS